MNILNVHVGSFARTAGHVLVVRSRLQFNRKQIETHRFATKIITLMLTQCGVCIYSSCLMRRSCAKRTRGVRGKINGI